MPVVHFGLVIEQKSGYTVHEVQTNRSFTWRELGAKRFQVKDLATVVAELADFGTGTNYCQCYIVGRDSFTRLNPDELVHQNDRILVRRCARLKERLENGQEVFACAIGSVADLKEDFQIIRGNQDVTSSSSTNRPNDRAAAAATAAAAAAAAAATAAPESEKPVVPELTEEEKRKNRESFNKHCRLAAGSVESVAMTLAPETDAAWETAGAVQRLSTELRAEMSDNANQYLEQWKELARSHDSSNNQSFNNQRRNYGSYHH